jgi:hypothetical protein
MEAFLARTQPLQSLHQKSCMGCGKGYSLGLRMPYKLICGHFLCAVCINAGVYCPLDRGNSIGAQPFYDQSLYTYPQCRSCLRMDFSFEYLPYHYFCDCIICDNCSLRIPFCTKCLDGVCNAGETRLKVHKRSLNKIRYFKVDLRCSLCHRNNSEYFSYDQYLPICSSCIKPGENALKIESTVNCDKALYDFSIYFLNDSKLPSDPIVTKIYKIVLASRQYHLPGYSVQSTLNFKEVKRFDKIYPLSREDRRSYLASQQKSYVLELLVNKPVKFCGLIVAGSLDGNKQIMLRIHNRQNLVNQFDFETKGKMNYCLFQAPLEVNYYKIEILFYQPGRFYCGKALSNDRSRVVTDGITFEFSDSGNENQHLKGPILSILYSV